MEKLNYYFHIHSFIHFHFETDKQQQQTKTCRNILRRFPGRVPVIVERLETSMAANNRKRLLTQNYRHDHHQQQKQHRQRQLSSSSSSSSAIIPENNGNFNSLYPDNNAKKKEQPGKHRHFFHLTGIGFGNQISSPPPASSTSEAGPTGELIGNKRYKFLVPYDCTVGQFQWILRNKIEIVSPNHAIYLIVQRTLPHAS